MLQKIKNYLYKFFNVNQVPPELKEFIKGKHAKVSFRIYRKRMQVLSNVVKPETFKFKYYYKIPLRVYGHVWTDFIIGGLAYVINVNAYCEELTDLPLLWWVPFI